MTNPSSLTLIKDALDDLIERSESWLSNAAELDNLFPENSRREIVSCRKHLGRLRKRAGCSLINIALFGAYSSGKSFLISGLQGGLTVKKIRTADGTTADKYVGLLPSAPTPTSACPASVVPEAADNGNGSSSRGSLRVRFTNSSDWVDIHEVPTPPMVAGYAMCDPVYIQARREDHWDREVAEIEILLGNFLLPAKLYDLPGYGSVNSIHDQVIRDAVDDADCFIFVTSATQALSGLDLELIRFLYKHHIASGKRIIWVAAGLDRASELGMDDRPAWASTVDQNNNYLREHFADDSFIGEGFIPVSAALEARGKLSLTEGRKEEGYRLIASSRMNQLRSKLEKLIEGDTGLPHLQAVANEIYRLLYPYRRAVSQRLNTERIPIDELASEKTALTGRIAQLNQAAASIQGPAETVLRQHVEAVRRTFSGLRKHLHDSLDPMIEELDLRSPRNENKLEVKKTQLIHGWLIADHGPSQMWDREAAAFRRYVLVLVQENLGTLNNAPSTLLPSSIDLEQLALPRKKRNRADTQDVLQRAAGVLGVVSPVATAGAAALGLASGAVLFVPVGIGVAAAVTWALVKNFGDKASSLDVLRSEYRAHLDEAVDSARDSVITAVYSSGLDTVGRAAELLFEEAGSLADSIAVLDERVGDPENQRRADTVSQLAPLAANGEELCSTLRAIATSNPVHGFVHSQQVLNFATGSLANPHPRLQAATAARRTG
jgi:hypothetical protein